MLVWSYGGHYVKIPWSSYSQPLILFSKANQTFLRYFIPINTSFLHKCNYFSGDLTDTPTETNVSADGTKEGKKETKLGMTSLKDKDFGQWYQNVVTESELISYYAVSGCYILRPWAFCMWESVTRFFDEKIKSIGVQNCMFPLFITEDVLNKEQDHIEVCFQCFCVS